MLIVKGAGDIRLGILFRKLLNPGLTADDLRIDQLCICAIAPHRIDLYLRRTVRHHNDAALAQQLAGAGQRLAEVA